MVMPVCMTGIGFYRMILPLRGLGTHSQTEHYMSLVTNAEVEHRACDVL